MRKKQSILGTLFFATFFFIGGFMAYQHFTKPLAKEAEASKKWPTVEGIVTQSELNKYCDNEDNDMYSANVRYKYSVGGKEYSDGNIQTLDGSTNVKSSVKKTVQKYAVGTQVIVYYDPEFPNTAVLEPGTSFLFGILLKLPLIFCAVAVLMVVGLLKSLLLGR